MAYEQDESEGNSEEDFDDQDKVVSECFISFQKIMRNELKAFDTRDSFVLRNNLSMSRRMSGHSLEFSINDMSQSVASYKHRLESSYLDPMMVRELFLQPRS